MYAKKSLLRLPLIVRFFAAMTAFVLLPGAVSDAQANYTVTPSPFLQRYNFYYSGIHNEPAYMYRTDGDTFQCTWDDDDYTYCEANDTRDNTASDTGNGASLMVEKFDSNILQRVLVNDFQTSGSIQGYGTIAEADTPTTWCGTNTPNICDASWKSCGIAELGNNLYACVVYNDIGYPYTSNVATEIVSNDHGQHWCNPTHATASGCVAPYPANSTKGDVPNPSDTPIATYGNPKAMRGLHFISYGQNNSALDSTAQNNKYAYSFMTSGSTIYCVRVPLSSLPALDEDDVQFYPNWDTGTNGSIPSDAAGISTPSKQMGNTIYVPGPNIYLSMVNNLISPSQVTYEGDMRIIEALHPWGPWYTVGEDLSQPTWNFGGQPLGATLAGTGPWTLDDFEAGYFLLTDTPRPDSDGYSEGTRQLTITSGAPSLPASQLDKDMQSFGSLYWLYDGEWHIGSDANWYTIQDQSGNGRDLTNEQYGGSPAAWNTETATYSQYGFGGLDGMNSQAIGPAEPTNSNLTYVLVFRQCCTAPNNYEELMAGNKSSDYTQGVDFQRYGKTRDSWQVLSYNTTSPNLTLTDGSYHLVILQQAGSTTNIYTSESLTNTPQNGGTVTPVVSFTTTPGNSTYPTYFGNLNGNTSSSANFFQGTLVLAAAYTSSFNSSTLAQMIYDIRMDLVNDLVNGYASSANVKRHVYLPFNFYGAWPLDYQPQPKASYATRRLSTNYTGPILQINNGTSNIDISPDSDGSGLITNNLKSACGNNTCVVTIWYDQSGNGFNLTPVNASDEIKVMSGGSFVATDPLGNPTLPFTGIESLQTGTQNFTFVSDSATVHAVASNTGTNADGAALAYLGNPDTYGSGVATQEMATADLLGMTSAGAVNSYRDGQGGASIAPLHAGGLFSATSVYDSFNHRMYVDGQTPQVLSNPSTHGGSGIPAEFYGYNFVVGWDTDSGANLHWKGNVSEVILYDYALTDTSASQLWKEDVTFYGSNH